MTEATERIRVATQHDATALAGLVTAFRDHLREQVPSDAEIALGLKMLLGDRHAEFAAAFSAGGAALGYSQTRYRYSLWAPGLEAELEDLFVHPSVRRRGLGSRLLEFAVSRARTRGGRRIVLTTNERNAEALRVYAKAGFTFEQRRWQGGRQLWLEKLL